jgi:hypothetical protein
MRPDIRQGQDVLYKLGVFGSLEGYLIAPLLIPCVGYW